MNHDSTDAPEHRRSTRLTISLPVVIHGKDAQQKAFRENTHTLILNRHGAKLVTALPLVVGAEVLVENPALGSVAKAHVVWVSSRRGPNGEREAGVQLVESQNIWGIEFPPDDWNKRLKELETPVAKAAPSPKLAPIQSIASKATPQILSSEEIATQVLRELHETADAHARQFRERLDNVVQRIGLELEIDLRERASAAKELELAEIDQQISAATEHLNKLKAEMEELDARLAATRQGVGATLESIPLPYTSEQIYEKIQEEAAPVLHLVIEGGIGAARERLQAQAQSDAAQALSTWRTSLYQERDSSLDETRHQIMAAVTTALDTLNSERDACLQEMKRRIQEETATAENKSVESWQARVQEMANQAVESSAEQIRAQVEKSAEAMAEKALQEWQAKLESDPTRFAGPLAERIQEQVSDALNAMKSKVEEMQEQAEEALRAMKPKLQEIQDEAEEALRAIKPRLQEMQDRAVNEALEAFRARLMQFIALLPAGEAK